jgi:hypothetical protein
MIDQRRLLLLATIFLLSPAMIRRTPALDPLAYSSLGNLSVTSTFNTDTLVITGGSGLTSTTGVTQSQSGGPTIAVFDFTNVSIGSGATVQVTGSRPIAILSRGNAIIDAAINVSGNNLTVRSLLGHVVFLVKTIGGSHEKESSGGARTLHAHCIAGVSAA